MKKNYLFLCVLVFLSTIAFGIDVVTSNGKYKSHKSTAKGLEINCGFNPWKDCYRTWVNGGHIVVEVNQQDGWHQLRPAVLRNNDGSIEMNPTLDMFFERRECGSAYDENGVLETTCLYNNVFLVD